MLGHIRLMRTTLLSLAACTALVAVPAVAQYAPSWNIGPIIRGKNYSQGMPAQLRDTREGAQFDFPGPTQRDGHVHYVTTPVQSLAGARSITLTYRIDAEPGTRFMAVDYPQNPATLSLYFQRAGDNWTARGRYETYRWYVTGDKMVPLSPGTHKITVDLVDDWKAVGSTTAASNPQAFREALANADKVGFTFGSAGGRGHGVYATGRARFTVVSFDIR